MVLPDTGGRLENLDNSWYVFWSITTLSFHRYREPMAIMLSLACIMYDKEVAVPDLRGLTFRKLEGHVYV